MARRIAIIGGGMTGLSLAYYLRQDGHQVRVLEKGPTLSGLLGFTTISTVSLERYYHHFFTTDAYLLALLNDLGLADTILWTEPQNAIWRQELYPFVTKLDYLRLPFLSWPTKFRGGLAALQLRMKKAETADPKMTAADLLRKVFGQAGWAAMWQPMLEHKFGTEAENISAQWILKRIQIRASSERHGREVLGYIQGSYRTLVEALVSSLLANGVEIVCNAEVTSLPRTSTGRNIVGQDEFDVVVSTVAPAIIKKIVPDLEMPDVRYRGALCPLFQLRSSPTPYYWITNLDPDIPFSVVVNQQALLPKNYYQGIWPLYVGHYLGSDDPLWQQSDEQLRDFYLGYLEKMFPGISGEVTGYEIGRAPFAQPIVTAPWQPLRHETNIPNLITTSMAHIFPEDRGINYSIREAVRVRELVNRSQE